MPDPRDQEPSTTGWDPPLTTGSYDPFGMPSGTATVDLTVGDPFGGISAFPAVPDPAPFVPPPAFQPAFHPQPSPPVSLAKPTASASPFLPPQPYLPPPVPPASGNGTRIAVALVGVLAIVGVTIAVVAARPWASTTASYSPSSGSTQVTSAQQYPTTQAPVATIAPAAVSAQQSLDEQIAADQSGVESLVGYWAPQFSAKKLGVVVGGVPFGYDEILGNYQSWKVRYPGALLLSSDRFSSYNSSTVFFVVVEPQTFSSSAEVLSWCAGQGLGRDDCAATRLSHTNAPKGSVVYQK